MKLRLLSVVSLFGVLGCSSAEGLDPSFHDSEGDIASLQEEIYETWDDYGESSITVGMAISGNNTYQWRVNGQDKNVCQGSWAAPCSGDSDPFTYPGTASVVGVGIAKNTGRVFAWYSDTKVSSGTPWNLTHYSGTRNTFTPGNKPGGGGIPFAMSDLIEVDNSDNGTWYYYWKLVTILPGGGATTEVYRTTGTSNNAAGSAAQLVTATSPNSIVGIAFGTGSPASIYTFRDTGTVNISTSSLNLSQ